MATSPSAKPATIVLVLLAVLAGGCGSSLGSSASPQTDANLAHTETVSACAPAVLDALSQVGLHVYDEGVSSERTEIAARSVTGSTALRVALERGDSRAVSAAVQTLVRTGRMTNLTVLRGGQTLASVGPPDALAPLHGTILSAAGLPIGSFLASVWTDAGFLAEMQGVVEGQIALRQGGHSIAGSFALPVGVLPPSGTLTRRGIVFQYASFAATAYSSGPLRIYILRPVASTAALCGHTPEDSLVATISHVASLIYAGEGGAHARIQVHRAQQDRALLKAVAERDPVATRRAVLSLVYGHTHIVRLRVSAGGHLLSDVGGPYVLAPVHAPLRLNGRQIGELELSIQDDEGYLRLAKRLAGLDVLMYMSPTHLASSVHPTLVKNSLGPNPGAVPLSGLYRYRGHTFNVFTLHARSFPSGPLRISVLIPLPYS